jgi:hypothetical protein
VTPWPCSQSRSAKSSVAVVPNVRTSCVRWPFTPEIRTHAAMLFLCTSSPHPRSMTRSMAPSLREAPGPGGAIVITSLLAVLEATMRGAGCSHVTFSTDSSYHSGSTLSGPRRRTTIPDFHPARAGISPMIVFLDTVPLGGGGSPRCRRPDHHTRPSSGRGSSSWPGPGARPRSWAAVRTVRPDDPD